MKNSYWLFGTRLSVLADQANTGGRYDLIEGWLSPGTQTPLHRHASPLRAALRAGRGAHRLGRRAQGRCSAPATTFTIPAGTAHAVARDRRRPGRALVVASPSGFARLITEAGTRTRGVGFRRPRPRTWTFSSASPPNWATRSSALPGPCPTRRKYKRRVGDRPR